MKIVIVWYWRMWKVVEFHAKEKWYEIVAIISPELWTKKEDLLNLDFDVIIEFSVREVALIFTLSLKTPCLKVLTWTTSWSL